MVGRCGRLLGSGVSLFGQGQSQSNPLLAQIQAAYQRRQGGQQLGLVRGRHLIDWVPTVREWLRDGREDDALALLLEIIEAAEQLARVDGAPPPAGYTEQAVEIYQRRGDEEGESSVLERYARSCPPGTGDRSLLARWKVLRDG